MAQFDVYPNLGGDRQHFPWLVDLQADFLAGLAVRVVAPLARLDQLGHRPLRGLTPEVELASVPFVVMIPQLAAIEARELTEPVGSLAPHRTQLLAALDLLFTGA